MLNNGPEESLVTTYFVAHDDESQRTSGIPLSSHYDSEGDAERALGQLQGGRPEAYIIECRTLARLARRLRERNQRSNNT